MIYKIRDIFRKSRKSEVLRRNLEKCCEYYSGKFIKPVLDVITWWNSTYDMLAVAHKLETAIRMLLLGEEWKNYRISDEESAILQKLLSILKHFKYVSSAIVADSDITLPMAVAGMNELLDKVESISETMDNKLDRSESDELLILALLAGRDKLIKHYLQCNWIYCLALILEPRYRIAGFSRTECGKPLKASSIKTFDGIYRKLY